MSETEASAAEQSQPKRTQGKQAATAAVKLPVSQLIEEASGFLGVPRHMAAGAFAGRDRDELLTVDEAKAAVKKWGQTPVEEGE